jgi:4-amino-4-deoxy-L-arabinose transferase-like glycosyltransferase
MLLAGIVLLAVALRCWGLDRNGFGNEYYSAGVRSMLEGWHNFFFNAFDPAGFISLDKPPVAFWIQAASARIFGFSGLSVLLPQVVEGIAAILVLFHLVRRRFGSATGLLAALFLALTPVSVAVDRSTNTESCLVLVLLLSAWALSVAVERASSRLLLLSAALLGIGFNVKMLAALVVAPWFVLLYGLSAPIALRRRLLHAAAAVAVLTAVSLSWSVAYDLTPAESRPFAGSSLGNSMLELAFDHNGLQRFIRRGRQLLARVDDGGQATVQQSTGTGPAPFGARNRLENVPAGVLRLASPLLAGQIGWLLPLAGIGLFAAMRRSRLGAALPPTAPALLLWGGWAVSYAVVFSGADGLFHVYYLATMAPPLAALSAIGATALWQRASEGGRGARLLPAALIATAAWQVFIAAGFPEAPPEAWWHVLVVLLIGGTVSAVVALLIPPAPQRSVATTGFAIGLATVLAMPAAWALSSVVASGRVQFPVAGAWQKTPADDPALRDARALQVEALLTFLRDNRHGERFLVAAPDARRASPLILASGEAVMALGGYSGADAILTPDALARLVAQRALRFVMIPSEDERGRRLRGNAALTDWVQQNGRPVDPMLWRTANEPATEGDPLAASGRPESRRPARGLASLRLYDLSPAEGAVAPTPPATSQ